MRRSDRTETKPFKDALDIVLFFLPKRWRRNASATIIILMLLMGAVLELYDNGPKLKDIWLIYIWGSPIRVELLSSEVLCDNRVSPSSWKDFLAYAYSSHRMTLRITNQLSHSITVDSIVPSYKGHVLEHYRTPTSSWECLVDIPTRRSVEATLDSQTGISSDSVAVRAVLDSAITLTVYCSEGTEEFKVPYFDFLDRNQTLVHTIGSRK